jgi:phosphoribosylamine---glycine ligase
MDSNTRRITVLLLGSGGREHALAWKLAQSQLVGRLVAAPGNPGIARHAELAPCAIDDPAAVVALARALDADLVVVGPEAPLAAGVADALRDAEIAVFGPSQAAARLEWDKAYAKDFMRRHGIPTAASRTFDAAEIDAARDYVAAHRLPVVIKASGLAAGKGVVVATAHDEAIDAVETMLSGTSFGDAGRTIVVEEFMAGEEASVFAVCDGASYVLLAPSQDHKRVGDGDTGPNTGGMGAYAPAPIVTDDLMRRVRTEVIDRALAGMRSDGSPYVGCLYVGLMIDGDEFRVVEFNCRFGDPETQVVLPLYRGDFGALLLAAATGGVASVPTAPSTGSAACIVMASSGYPGSYATGARIDGLDAELEEGVVVFHAGTKSDDGAIVTSGGRVLGVTAHSTEDGLDEVVQRAYRAVEGISFAGAHYRRDIGRRALERAR